MKLALTLLLAAALAGCGSKPRAPDFQMNAHDALERYTTAYMSGNARVEAAEFELARKELASTAQPGRVAGAELTRCALRVASLALEPCAGFEPLRADSPAPARAYADYLAGRIKPSEVGLLPVQHRPIASGQGAAGVKAIEDPLSRLVAAGEP